ncbi:transcriptional regulator XRE [Acidisphaera rubrifaciens HS-AP3]|uniref:Transcriptional regulator XRE n=1 Tax=Acidisphaera rubrifaciens HS-AP3 TaxID=1231350 RepID=A0A0D6P992_9PROT|nr:transcriptional regulator XRE [Acidisphaera rubrifaciens HS-AP3]
MHPVRRPGGSPVAAPVGALLRAWRQRRRRSQLDLALDAEVSARHLSFVESGRARPSREMVLRLAETLDVPLRERNALLLAAGFAPVHAEQPLDGPGMRAARGIVERILRAHGANPALAVDRHWHMVAANEAVPPLLAGVADAALLRPPVNVLRLSLHPGGLAPRIANLPDWRAHVLDRLRRQAEASADPALAALLAELVALGSAGEAAGRGPFQPGDGIAVPLELDTAAGRLSLISTTTVFGMPTEVTVSELAIEAFYPVDEASERRLRQLQRSAPGGDGAGA